MIIIKRIGEIIQTTALYCLIIILFGIGALASNTTFFQNNSTGDTRHSIVSADLLVQTNTSEQLFRGFERVVSSVSKISIGDWVFFAKAESSSVSLSLKYITCSGYRVVGFKQTDIIFPFHYFW